MKTKPPKQATKEQFEKYVLKLITNKHSRFQYTQMETGSHCNLYWTSGESSYYTTMSGKTRIHYPSAYRWPKMYHPSTRTLHIAVSNLASLYKLKRGWYWAYYNKNACAVYHKRSQTVCLATLSDMDKGVEHVMQLAMQAMDSQLERNTAERLKQVVDQIHRLEEQLRKARVRYAELRGFRVDEKRFRKFQETSK